MGQVKKCPHCGNDLYCRSCSKRVTPDLRRKGPRASVNLKMQAETVDKLHKLAVKHGLNLTEIAELAITKLDTDDKAAER